MSVNRHRATAPSSLTVAVITVSDTRTEATDESGRLIRELAVGAGINVAMSRILPDEPEDVRKLLLKLLEDDQIDGVILNGGTGIATRDRTYEAVSVVIERRLDGFGELFRALSYEEIGSAAMMSRAVAGLAGRKVIFSLPGSTSAVRLAMEKLILPELGHLVGEARKGSIPGS
jgi:molybdenum cofactor biosynthesis protein B